MNEIIVQLKPDFIGWEDLAKCQQRAHESNKAMGVNMQCAEFTASRLEAEVMNGTTLVALDTNKHLMGMLSIVYKEVNRWWHKGTAAYICYVAVTPEFKGKGVYKALANKADKIVASKGLAVEYLHTHAGNISARKAYTNDGYKNVRFSPGNGMDYYSVEMAKWLGTGKGKNNLICWMMFSASEFIVKLFYKPGKIRRF